MKTVLLVALLWQLVHADADGPSAEPQHFRYERTIDAGSNTLGRACAVLDAAVFKHASSEALGDLRLYAQPSGVETPFAISVSGTQSDDEDVAAIQNLGKVGGDIVFDARMPARPYSSIHLNIAAKDFVGTVDVSGVTDTKAAPVRLGTFTIFDLSAQHLAHWTDVPMQENTFPLLHFTVRLVPASGRGDSLGPSIMTGVSVPPSREAETLYTDVALSPPFAQQGHDSVASVVVMPHVAIDRIRFALLPGVAGNFVRQVSITATPMSGNAATAESVTGEIARVKMSAGANGIGAIDYSSLMIETPLVTNLKTAADIRIAVKNGDGQPLPLAPAHLEMRQRKICFDTVAEAASYRLMYGDAAVAAPVYDYARLYEPSAKSGTVLLGPEQSNAGYRARPDARPFMERHPGLLWVTLLAAICLLGSMVLRGARSRKT